MTMFTSNAPAAKFAQIGDSVSGEITDFYRTQRYEFVRGGVGQPLYWHNRKPTAGARLDPATGKRNDPVLQSVITLDTGEADENGDTERRLFIKNQRMEKALTKAVMEAGGRRVGGLLLGGRLTCTFTEFDETSDAPQPPKVYEFVYVPPEEGKGRPLGAEVRVADRDEEDLRAFVGEPQEQQFTPPPAPQREPVRPATFVAPRSATAAQALGITRPPIDPPF